ncbi:hypothetical protein P6F26_03745 [Roseibacterium sp. SDUM158017]|uniref:hypothetical protein n=1 Tax=Roseicyclus salinarum TaxID=3036773 RepID=UPI0024157233|nr:hypothetical protein [Roseibacterium sp. SDUM158017]MDG4647544.1 hypothetical protein [Roseibacterium sp. SDUM158017]
MPPLSSLALRYVAWFVGLTFVYGLLVSFAGLPATLATGVIIAAAPAADVGLHAVRRATRPLAFRDWVTLWGLCMGIYLLLSIVGPAVLALAFSQVREGIGGAAMMRSAAIVASATALMMALFLWIGGRSAGGRNEG